MSGLSDLWIKCSASRYDSGPTIEEITVLQGSDDGIHNHSILYFLHPSVFNFFGTLVNWKSPKIKGSGKEESLFA